MAGQGEWSPEQLWRTIDEQRDLFVLDVRSPDEFEAAPLEGRVRYPGRNLPYYELLDLDDSEDVTAAARAALERGAAGALPDDRTVLAVCPQGHTSSYVAEALRQIGIDAVNLSGGMAAWGDYYHLRPVAETAEGAVYQVIRPARGDLSHVIVSDRKAAIIDPGRHIDVYTSLASERGWTIARVLDTHQHADHISGGPALAERLGLEYELHPYDAIHPIDMLPATFGYRPLFHGDRLPLGRIELEVVHLPGHTLGMSAFKAGEWLFAGDSVFIGSVARPDLGGRPEEWTPLFYRSLKGLLTFAGATLVLPGHFSDLAESEPGEPFADTLERLRETNPGLRKVAEGEEPFSRHILESLPEFPESYVEIKRINAGLVTVDEQRAQELETGKNVCALS